MGGLMRCSGLESSSMQMASKPCHSARAISKSVNYTWQFLIRGRAKSHCQGLMHFPRLQNLIKGVQAGFEYKMRLVYTHFRRQSPTVG